MLDVSFILLVLVIVTAMLFDYINGFHDTANSIATCVSTRALSVKSAIFISAGLNFIGAMVSTKVATTIGKGIADPTTITQTVILAGLIGAITWNLITWYYGIPSSSSHALIGGLVGSVIAHAGLNALIWTGLKKIVLSLIISPIIGTIFGFFFMVAIFWLFRKKNPHILNRNFRFLQILSASFMAFSHGTADAQKTMGIMTMALVSYGTLQTFEVPTWIKGSAAIAMALGTAAGGWRIIKTLGKDFVKLQPVHGFAAETSSAVVILGAASVGMPVSTTHVITSSILGVGLSKRISAVNWVVARRIVLAWIITIPASGFVGAVIYVLITQFLPS